MQGTQTDPRDHGGKAFHKAVYLEQDKATPPDHCYSVEGRRREEGVTVQLVFAHKLRKAGIAHTTAFEDIRSIRVCRL